MAFRPDAETSLRLFEEGGCFIFEAVPPGTQVGIDMESWTTGEKFRGIKMIPPGLHFIHFSTVSRDGHSQSPRLGFFHTFKRGEIVLRKYDRVSEDFVETSDVEEVSGVRLRLKELDQFLGPYPYASWRKWISLSNKITEPICGRLCPESGRICSAPELTLDEDQSSIIVEQPRQQRMSQLDIAESLLPRMTETEASRIRYTQLPPPPLHSSTAQPSLITHQHLDWTLRLETMLQACGGPVCLLAELQFSFVCFLVAQNYRSFEHWKGLIELICNSDSALLNYPNLFIDFLSDLYFQITQVHKDLLTDIVTQNNFIYTSLKRLFGNIRESSGVESRLVGKAERFIKFLHAKLGWVFCREEEEDENRPVVVE